MDLIRRIENREGGFLLFALTPPCASTESSRVREIAEATKQRLQGLGLDGLVLYDIDDESARNPLERPFPFTPTLDPATYGRDHLGDGPIPTIVYRAVSKYTAADLTQWLSTTDPARTLTVLVGAASGTVQSGTSLTQAQALRSQINPALTLGGVAIPERHARRGDEHLRLLAKQEAGCRFFVTQVVYDLNAAKNLISDYHYECERRGQPKVPLVFTFSVCGSLRTLEFLQWLGVEVPRWIENDLRHASDPLEASYEHALAIAIELITFCRSLGVPAGLNVESVSIRRVEIEASVRLAAALRAHLDDEASSG